jgi:hypothetical protein
LIYFNKPVTRVVSGKTLDGTDLHCSNCKKLIKVEKGYFNCNNGCDYDLCQICVQLPKCTRNHIMNLRVEPVERKSFFGWSKSGQFIYCNKCRVPINYKGGYFNCGNYECNLDLCMQCGKISAK